MDLKSAMEMSHDEPQEQIGVSKSCGGSNGRFVMSDMAAVAELSRS